MTKTTVKLDETTATTTTTTATPASEDTLDKRPWLMDALLYIGNCMASITHIREKQQYLLADIESGTLENEDYIKKADELSHLNELHEQIYNGYNITMSFIMDSVPGAKKEYRCLLKHTSTMLTMALEMGDAVDNASIDDMVHSTFNAFAGAVSLALNIEFKSCIRCIYDGLKEASDTKKLAL